MTLQCYFTATRAGGFDSDREEMLLLGEKIDLQFLI